MKRGSGILRGGDLGQLGARDSPSCATPDLESPRAEVAHDNPCSASRTSFRSSWPPSAAAELSLATLVRTLAHCTHPGDCTTPAEVVEPDDSRMTIHWCGICGALHIPGDDNASTWIVPGFGSPWVAEDRLTRVARDLGEIASEVEKASQAVRTLIMNRAAWPPASGPAWPESALSELDRACAQIQRTLRGALRETET